MELLRGWATRAPKLGRVVGGAAKLSKALVWCRLWAVERSGSLVWCPCAQRRSLPGPPPLALHIKAAGAPSQKPILTLHSAATNPTGLSLRRLVQCWSFASFGPFSTATSVRPSTTELFAYFIYVFCSGRDKAIILALYLLSPGECLTSSVVHCRCRHVLSAVIDS